MFRKKVFKYNPFFPRMVKFRDKKCNCTTKNVKLLTQEDIEELLKEVQGWEVVNNHHLRKQYQFPNYLNGVQFVNQLAAIAEEQNHHPLIHLDYRKVTVEIYTHVVNGLTDNDFILAAKYDALKK